MPVYGQKSRRRAAGFFTHRLCTIRGGSDLDPTHRSTSKTQMARSQPLNQAARLGTVEAVFLQRDVDRRLRLR